MRFIGQTEARALVLPLHATGNIRQGNALRIDWEEVCPPVAVSVEEQDLGGPTGRLNLENEAESTEVILCGNPPYKGARKQEPHEKKDLELCFRGDTDYKDADYVSGWFLKAFSYISGTRNRFAFVSTSSICQGEQVQFIWPRMWDAGLEFSSAYWPFKWKNNAANNAGVYVTILGVRNRSLSTKDDF